MHSLEESHFVYTFLLYKMMFCYPGSWIIWPPTLWHFVLTTRRGISVLKGNAFIVCDNGWIVTLSNLAPYISVTILTIFLVWFLCFVMLVWFQRCSGEPGHGLPVGWSSYPPHTPAVYLISIINTRLLRLLCMVHGWTISHVFESL